MIVNEGMRSIFLRFAKYTLNEQPYLVKGNKMNNVELLRFMPVLETNTEISEGRPKRHVSVYQWRTLISTRFNFKITNNPLLPE